MNYTNIRVASAIAGMIVFASPRASSQGLGVSGTVGLNFSASTQGSQIQYSFLDEDFVNLTFQIVPQELAISVNSIAIGNGTALWSNAFTWDSPLLAINTAADFVSLVDHVTTPVPGILSIPGDLHALQNEGPTEYTVSVMPIHWVYNGVEIANVPMAIPIKWDVTIPSGANVNMDQTSVTAQSLTVNSGAILAANSSLATRTDLINHGSITNLGGTIEGNFVNDGSAASGAGTGISSNLFIQGTFFNPGAVTIQSGATLRSLSPIVNDGTIALLSGGLSVPKLTNNGTLSGYTAGFLGMNIDNYGMITANVNQQQLTLSTNGTFSPTINNYGSLVATNGGILAITATVNGGTITANNGSVVMQSGLISGCTLNGGRSDLFTLNGEFDNIVNNAQILSYFGFAVGGGSLVNNGNITIGAGVAAPQASFECLTATNITGGGNIVFDGGGIYSGSGTITSDNLIHGWGNLWTSNINSYGNIVADVNGQTLNLGGNGIFNPIINNYSSLMAINGGTLAIYTVINGGLIAANGGTIVINAGGINGSTLSGSGVFIANSADFSQITNDAAIMIPGGHSASVSGSLVNNNKITVGDGTSTSRLALIGTTNVIGSGQIVLNNGIITGGGNSMLAVGQGGTVSGSGTVSVPFVNGGTISTGLGGGPLIITNAVSLLSTAALQFEIGGLSQGTEYGFLNVSGVMGLAGVLELDFANGFEMQVTPDETFTILGAGSLSGIFTNVSNGARLTTEDGLGSFVVNYGPNSPYGSDNVVLSQEQVVPEPGVLWYFVGGSFALLFLRFRRLERKV